jgi:hypothetical protein
MLAALRVGADVGGVQDGQHALVGHGAAAVVGVGHDDPEAPLAETPSHGGTSERWRIGD